MERESTKPGLDTLLLHQINMKSKCDNQLRWRCLLFGGACVRNDDPREFSLQHNLCIAVENKNWFLFKEHKTSSLM